MIELRITLPVLSLKRTPPEKILLAYLCQRAADTDGTCTDSNREIASGTAIHLQTVSDLINRLSQTTLLEAKVDAALSNQRTLRPSEELVAYYKPNDYSLPEPYKSNDYSSQTAYKPNDYSPENEPKPSVQPTRFCPASGIDITHQPQDHKVATKSTLFALYISDRARFNKLVDEHMTPEQAKLPTAERCFQLNLNLRKQAKIQVADEVELRAPKLNERFCPITGVDIGRQRNDVRYLSGQTLERLARKETPTYLALAAWLIPEEKVDLAYPGRQSSLMANLVRELAASGLPIKKPELPIRRCPVTRIDLSKLSPNYTIVTASTLTKMFDEDRTQFDEVAREFLTPTELNESKKGQCRTLIIRIQQKARKMAEDSKRTVETLGMLSAATH